MPNPITEQVCMATTVRNKTIFTAGRVTSWEIKGYDLLIKAWALICNKYLDWRVQIAGNGDGKSFGYLNQLISDCNAERVEFLGFRSDVKELMSRSEVYCLSSRVEGLPMGLLEAMNVGCCCVSFDCITGPGEIIVNKTNGLLVNPEDVQGLAESLSYVIENETIRKEIAIEASQSVKKYSVKNVVDRWEILFKLLIKK